jgi:hypothetical protein
VADALHQVAVAAEDEGAVVDGVETVAGVDAGGEHALGKGHADGVGDALPEGAGGGLDADGVAVFGVARRQAVELAEVLEVVDGEGVAGEVEQAVEEHAAVAAGEHETVAVGPVGARRVVAQMLEPEDGGDIGHAHGQAGVAGVGGLDPIDRKATDGIGGERKRLAGRLGHDAILLK